MVYVLDRIKNKLKHEWDDIWEQAHEHSDKLQRKYKKGKYK